MKRGTFLLLGALLLSSCGKKRELSMSNDRLKKPCTRRLLKRFPTYAKETSRSSLICIPRNAMPVIG